MPVISTNIAGVAVLYQLNSNTRDEASALSKLASGARIVDASDDPSGLAIGTQLQAGGAVLAQDQVNLRQGLSLVQTADAGLAQISSVLARMMALAATAASGQVTDIQRSQDIQTEYAILVQEINSIAASTQFGGTALLNFASATTTGGFSWQSSSVLDGFFQAQVLRDSQGPEGAGYNVPGDGLVENTGQVARYTSGIDGLPTGTSGTFDAAPLESGDTPPYGPAAFLVAANGSPTLSVSIGAANSVSLGLEQDVVSYADAPVTAVDVTTTVLAPTPHTVTVSESAATWLAANPGQNLPGTVTTSVASTISNLGSQSAALLAVATIGSAIHTISAERAKMGAYEAQFQFSSQSVTSDSLATSASTSLLLDCDVAVEKMKLTAIDVKTQGSVAALTQAAELPRELLKLINAGP